MNGARFARYVGIDYSGAETSTAGLKGLRVYLGDGGAVPVEVPPASPRKYWNRRGVAEWLVELLAGNVPTLVGIDHGFSFPLRYFEAHRLKPDWPTFWKTFESIGQPTRTIPTSTLSAMVSPEKARHEPVAPGGAA